MHLHPMQAHLMPLHETSRDGNLRDMDEEFVVETWHYVLAKHAKAMCALERELGERHGLGPSEFEVLDRIVHHDKKLRIQELCEEVHLSQSALSRVVARLEKSGLVNRGACEVDRRGAATFEVTERANQEFLDRMTDRLEDSVFVNGSCATSRSYYFNQHGMATLLRPTSTINAFREAGSFPLDDYAYA